ncbi:MAG TPA: MATE family efflux transporter, partial [Bacillota bacterium]
LIARAIGAGDPRTANEAARQSAVLNLALSLVMAVLGYAAAPAVVAVMGGSGEALRLGTLYLRWTALFFPMQSLTLGLSAVLRGAGDTVSPLRINALANVLTVLLGYPLIYGLAGVPGLGIVGAALATGMAKGVALALLAANLLSGRGRVRIPREGAGWRPDLARRIITVGAPAAGEQLVMRMGMVLFTRLVAGLGTETFAAHQIALNVLGLSFMPGMAFAVAATTLVGQCLGAGQPDAAERAGWEVRRRAMGVTITMAGAYFALGPWIVALYSQDPLVISQGALALKIMALAVPAQTTQFVLAGALRGAGDTRWPLYATAAGMWGVRVALGVLFVSAGWGLAGAWSAMVLDQMARSVFIYLRFRAGAWKALTV